MKRIAPAVLVLLCAVPAVAAGADGDRPRGSYVIVPFKSETMTPRFGPGPKHRILYMNRHGGTYYPGDDNSFENTSIVPYGTSEVSAFDLGDSAWGEVMSCVREMYAAFDVEITDVDPGTAPHIESVVGGYPQEVGMGSGVGGVAPMEEDCSVVEQAIVFTFAGVYGDDVQSICETVAQESAHALGLDHEYLCEDPMTYLYGCGSKSFQDIDAQCGEYSARTCQCGGATQNSVQLMLQILGPSDSIAPELDIVKPLEGETVQAGFAIEATAADNKGVVKIELFIDGVSYATDETAPWAFTAPAMMADGPHTVELRAHDSSDNMTPALVNVTVGQPPPDPPEPPDPGGADDCNGDGDCAAGETCGADGMCHPDGEPGGGDWDPDATGGCAVSPRGESWVVVLLLGLVVTILRRRKSSR